MYVWIHSLRKKAFFLGGKQKSCAEQANRRPESARNRFGTDSIFQSVSLFKLPIPSRAPVPGKPRKHRSPPYIHMGFPKGVTQGLCSQPPLAAGGTLKVKRSIAGGYPPAWQRTWKSESKTAGKRRIALLQARPRLLSGSHFHQHKGRAARASGSGSGLNSAKRGKACNSRRVA